jgi:hypothetical protein
VDGHQDEDEHRRQEIDGDRPRPGRQEVAGIAQHRRRRGERYEAFGPHSRRREDLLGRRRERLGLRCHGPRDVADDERLPLAKISRVAAGDRRDEGRGKVVRRPAHRWRDRRLLQARYDAGERHRRFPE